LCLKAGSLLLPDLPSAAAARRRRVWTASHRRG